MKLLWQQIANPVISELLSIGNQFDGVVLDTEHGAFSDETLYTCIRTIQLSGKAAFVRVTHLDKKLVRMVLDANARGVIFSTVESVEQAQEIKEFCLYPPEGKRGQGLVRENLWGRAELGKRRPCLVGQIETTTGVLNLCDITLENAFEYYLVGPYDLSASVGSVGDFEAKEFKRMMQIISHTVPEKKLGYHIVKNVAGQLDGLKSCGMLAFSMDTMMLVEGTKGLERLCFGKDE